MKVLWLCGLPYEVQHKFLGGENYGAEAAWSWVMAHLPPPPGVELHIACRVARHRSSNNFEYAGARFHLVPVKARARVFTLFRFDWRSFHLVAASVQPDVIHGWGTEDGYARAAIRLAPARHVVQVQGLVHLCRARTAMPWKTWFSARSEKLALAQARHVLAENDFALRAARPLMSTQAARVIEHPVRRSFLTAPPTNGDGRTVLFFGLLDPRKGLWDGLEAFRRAAPLDWRLVIIGSGPPGVQAELDRRIRTSGMSGRVTRFPDLSPEQIVQQMQAASVFLLPTWVDTGPTTLKEALVMGLWPVCYDNTGPGHYLRQFQFGALAKDRNVDALTECLRATLTEQPWREAAQRAKVNSFIRPHFSPERIWPELLATYRQVCDTSWGEGSGRGGGRLAKRAGF